MTKFIWLIAPMLFTTGCMTMPADVDSYESKTDNVKHIHMEPGWLGFSLQLGLHKSSTMLADEATMIVAVRDNAASTKEGLTINVDGKKTVLSAMDDMSDLDSHRFFRKRYAVKMDLIRQMVAGKSVWVKVSHVGQTYSEGEFSNEKSMSAKRGFIQFLSKVDEVKTPSLK